MADDPKKPKPPPRPALGLTKATGIGADPRVPSRTGVSGLANWIMSALTGVPIYPEQEAGPVDLLLAAAPIVGKAKSLKAFATGAKEAGAAKTGIRAYHGSPHDFDKFAAEKIGTGEGAQAYGHGLYFAESEGTAKSYRDALTKPPVPSLYPQLDSVAKRHLAAGMDIPTLTAKLKHDFGVADWEITDAIRNAQYQPGHMYEVNIKADPAHFLDWDAPISQQGEPVKRALRQEGISGKRYQVGVVGDGHLGSQNDRYIFDSAVEARAFAQQLRAPGNDYQVRVFHSTPWEGELTGKDVLRKIEDKAARDPGVWDNPRAYAAEYLKEIHGIPGVKYLDQGSRGGRAAYRGDRAYLSAAESFRSAGQSPEEALTGLKQAYKTAKPAELQAAMHEAYDITPQSRNLVVFPGKEDLIDILRKYGWLPPVAGMGYLSQVGPSKRGPS